MTNLEAEQMKTEFQPFPTTGQLANNMNLNLISLQMKIGHEQADVYCYVIATIKNRKGQFFQIGSGPNFQGDLISLCTCKQFMRTFMAVDEWPGKWIAGFSGVAAGHGHNVLVYLMRVGHAFCSHQSLWLSGKISSESKEAKSAEHNKFGDLYRPKTPMGDPFTIQSYHQPHKEHGHAKNNKWHNDINYEKGRKGRKASLLIGDSDYSFLWDRPMLVYHHGRIHRGQKKINLSSLLNQLKEFEYR